MIRLVDKVKEVDALLMVHKSELEHAINKAVQVEIKKFREETGMLVTNLEFEFMTHYRIHPRGVSDVVVTSCKAEVLAPSGDL